MSQNIAIKSALQSNVPAFGFWLTIPSAAVAKTILRGESGASVPFTWTLVDAEHGLISDVHYYDLANAVGHEGASPIIRVPSGEEWMIKRALDAGAHGVMTPMCHSEADAAKVVSYAKYPPLGIRGYGPMFAPHSFPGTEPGAEYDTLAQDILVAVQIESRAGVENVAKIAEVDGVDVIFIGPFDLSKQMGVERGGQEHEAAIQKALGAAHAANKKCAIFCTDGADALTRVKQGFDMISVNTDVGPSAKKSRPADDDAQSAETSRLSPEDVPAAITPEDEDIMNETRNFTDNDGEFMPQFQTTLEPEVIEGLVDVFYYVGYPLRPYFHWPTFRSQVEQKKYQSDWGIFIVTMAVCCFAAGRLNDGISIPSGLHNLRAEASLKSTECYDAAIKAIPKELTEVTDWYSLMKAKSLLASACLHNEQLKRALFHGGGDYVSFSVSRGFHDEANWPEDLNECEKQERRRLFWGSYQHDQHLAKMFGFISRHREAKAAVQYPSEVYDDTDITSTGIQQRPAGATSFLQGWNFCTDLYRILEQIDACSRLDRQTSVDRPGGKVTAFLACRQSPKVLAADSLRLLAQLYEGLPDDLKRIKAITGDPRKIDWALLVLIPSTMTPSTIYQIENADTK
ncbi:hypothetical protein CcaCcLH18_09036 [Colletotrichum camelliae]|nr:hypothetical protein CcaCcLH18_09036 [Colletotrichum camelliae]